MVFQWTIVGTARGETFAPFLFAGPQGSCIRAIADLSIIVTPDLIRGLLARKEEKADPGSGPE